MWLWAPSLNASGRVHSEARVVVARRPHDELGHLERGCTDAQEEEAARRPPCMARVVERMEVTRRQRSTLRLDGCSCGSSAEAWTRRLPQLDGESLQRGVDFGVAGGIEQHGQAAGGLTRTPIWGRSSAVASFTPKKNDSRRQNSLQRKLPCTTRLERTPHWCRWLLPARLVSEGWALSRNDQVDA